MPEMFYATGHRKTATAKIWLFAGSGNVTVNKRAPEEYFNRDTLEEMIREPFLLTHTEGRFDVRASCLGGGIPGQAGAMRHGIARALVAMDESLRPILRRSGLLTRDPREKERKHAGFRRARRGKQFSKR
jgi:small subunit ribosomal protein S9